MGTKNFVLAPKKRGKRYIPPLLSERDEFVPKTHIGMYALLRNENNKSIYMGEEPCQKMRKDTYNAVLELYKRYGAPNYCDFWNFNHNEITELGLNHFAKHPKLARISPMIECFSKDIKLRSNGHPRRIISFGINRRELRIYLYEVQEAKKQGKQIPSPPEIYKKGKNFKREYVIFGEEAIKLAGGTIKTDRNAAYSRFRHWCDLQGISPKDGATMALELVVDTYPIKGVQDIAAYDVITEFDKLLLVKPKEGGDRRVTVNINGLVYEVARQIIRRYNRDIGNLAKPTMNLETYVNNALHLLNQNMPLKYRDPELYEQKRQIDLMQEQSGIKEEDEDSDGFEIEEDDKDLEDE